MKKLIIIRGYCGTGKSTVAKQIAHKYKFAFLEYDTFLWAFNPQVKPNKEIYELTFKNFLSVYRNYLRTAKSILIEGPLVPRTRDDPFNLKKVILLAKKSRYDIRIIQLICDEKESIARMRKRKHIVPKWERDMFINKHKETMQTDEIVINTTSLNLKQVIDRVKTHI